jgi:hypothetical protein
MDGHIGTLSRFTAKQRVHIQLLKDICYQPPNTLASLHFMTHLLSELEFGEFSTGLVFNLIINF